MQVERRFRACVAPIVLSLILTSAATATEAAERQAYEPAAEIVLPTDELSVPRAVEEKDGYAYLLTREGTLYTYDISDLPLRESFVTYDMPVDQQTLYAGNGLVRYGDYLYAFGRNGIQTIDVQDPCAPLPLGFASGPNIYNLVRHEDYLIAAGAERLVVYSIAEPSNPTLLSDLNLGQEELAWSVAGYGRTLYACHFWSDWQGTYVNTLSVIDFSDPAHLAVLKAIRRDDLAYHLRVIGDRLLECTSNQVGLWDLSAPADPVLLTSQQAAGRVAALDGPHIVTNGSVFRPDANDLHLVATFAAEGSQQDGYPHGSAVGESFVFLAQTQRILILNAIQPVLTANHASGGPGSFFTITGADFAPFRTATITVNGSALGEVATDSAGGLLFLLDTEQADEGSYVVTATADRRASAGFAIASGESVHPQEDDGPVFEVPPQIAYGKYSGGNGTAADPYQIATAEDLMLLGDSPEDYDKHFILTADIDLDPNLPGGKVFDKAVIAPDTDPRSDWYFQGKAFTGSFDGHDHTISHLTITGGSYLGLFGQLGSWDIRSAEVENLELVDVKITGTGTYVGGLIGHSDGSISNCCSSGSVCGTNEVGGLVGGNLGTIHMSHSNASVSGTRWGVGGLVGGIHSGYGSITMSYSSGSVKGIDCVGGLVGTLSLGAITGSHSSADVDGKSWVGGLVGANYEVDLGCASGGVIVESHSEGNVRGGRDVGGLVGGNSGSIVRSYSRSLVRGVDCIGGLVGQQGCGSIADSYSSGAVDGTSQVGGLIGSDTGFWVRRSFWDVQASNQSTSAGGVGKTTAEMQMASTFLDAGWDFVGETANGTDDIWWIDEGKDYPRLWWELDN